MEVAAKFGDGKDVVGNVSWSRLFWTAGNVVEDRDCSLGKKASAGVLGLVRWTIASQKTRHATTQNTASRFVSRWAVRNLASSALQPDMSTL